jgi:mandelate racemase
MSFQLLTLKSIRARPVVLKLRRPVVARIATLTDWPLILIDLYTEEGVIGRSYLEPYPQVDALPHSCPSRSR